MEYLVLSLTLIWLAIVSWFDLRKREVPHSAWVIVPFVLALVYRAAHSYYELAVLAIIIAFVSERKRLAQWSGIAQFASPFLWLPLVVVTFFRAGAVSPIGAVAIVCFWAAWELHCWGGADAVVAIVLALLWPDTQLILALFAVHAVVALVTTITGLVRDHRFRLHVIPGLPLLLLTVLLREAMQIVPLMKG